MFKLYLLLLLIFVYICLNYKIDKIFSQNNQNELKLTNIPTLHILKLKYSTTTLYIMKPTNWYILSYNGNLYINMFSIFGDNLKHINNFSNCSEYDSEPVIEILSYEINSLKLTCLPNFYKNFLLDRKTTIYKNYKINVENLNLVSFLNLIRTFETKT